MAPTDTLPTGPPLGTLTLRTGTATFALTGDLKGTYTAHRMTTPSIYQPLPGEVAISWNDQLVIRGPLNIGEQTTSRQLQLSIGIGKGGDTPKTTIASNGDECSIVVATGDATTISGTFQCHGLGGQSVDASGTFTAST